LQNGIIPEEGKMPAITLKNIPVNLYNSLKESAKIHHRSINKEAVACFEKALGALRIEPNEFLSRITNLRSQIRIPKLTERALKKAKETGRS